jgi:hypothetical protein
MQPIVPVATAAQPPEHETIADPMSYCPTCSSRMRETRCKLKCDTCGFYLSCSDFY